MISKMNPMEMLIPDSVSTKPLVRWLQRASLVTMALAFVGFILLTLKVYHEAPPIPLQVTSPDGSVLFNGNEIREGQQIILKYGLMDNGWIWARKTMFGPDFSEEYLHTLARHGAASIAQQRFGVALDQLLPEQRAVVVAQVRQAMTQNHYDPKTGVLTLGPAYGEWFRHQSNLWQSCFSDQMKTGRLNNGAVIDADELKQLSAFVGWSVWASATNRAKPQSANTKNFAFDPLAPARQATQYCG